MNFENHFFKICNFKSKILQILLLLSVPKNSPTFTLNFFMHWITGEDFFFFFCKYVVLKSFFHLGTLIIYLWSLPISPLNSESRKFRNSRWGIFIWSWITALQILFKKLLLRIDHSCWYFTHIWRKWSKHQAFVLKRLLR